MKIDLTEEIAVVTGVSGRLGRVWSTALAQAGARVVGLDLQAEPPAGFPGAGERCAYLRADVTDRSQLTEALASCVALMGTPTVLVNNAGIDSPPGANERTWLFEDVPDQLSTAVFDVNALGALRVCQVFGSAMRAQGRGSVINIGSLYGSVAPDTRMYEHIDVDPPFLKPPAYGMSKAALSALTRYLAALWGPFGVRVNTLAPGGVFSGQDEVFRAKFSSRVPLGRLACPEDLVGPLLFLASGLSRYVTGTELRVDGGFQCW